MFTPTENISILLPTINESENLKILIPQLVTVLEELNIHNYEIIVIDDGSTDNTDKLIKKFNNENNLISILNRKTKPSLPDSIFDGIEKSKSKYVLWLDADGSMPAATVKKLLKKLNYNSDAVIIGSRFTDEGGFKGIEEVGKTTLFQSLNNVRKSNDSIMATLLSLILNKLLSFLLSTNIKDITSGFIVGKKEYFSKDVFDKGNYGDYFIYLIDSLYKKNIEMIELGYICETRIYGESKTGSGIKVLFKTGLPYIKAVITCRINRYGNKR
tara:strand:- start:107 stop:919 length:813 start_codon:yes stop_codon:yes gene_type:complete